MKKVKSQGLGVHRWEEDDNLDYDFDHDEEDDDNDADNDNGDNDTDVDNNDDVFSAEEIEQFGKSDLLVLSEMLGDKVTVMVVIIIINIIMIVKIIIITIMTIMIIFINWILQEFFFGDEPALLDLVVYAHVAQLVRMIKIIMILISKFVLIISDIKGDGGGRDILSIERLH